MADVKNLPYRCARCTYASFNYAAYKRHLLIHQKERLTSTFLNKTMGIDSTKKIQDRLGPKEYRCNICSYSCRSKVTYQKHMQQCHPNTQPALHSPTLEKKLSPIIRKRCLPTKPPTTKPPTTKTIALAAAEKPITVITAEKATQTEKAQKKRKNTTIDININLRLQQANNKTISIPDNVNTTTKIHQELDESSTSESSISFTEEP